MAEMSIMVGIVMALAQVIKSLEIIAVKCIPLVNLFFGVAMCLLFSTGSIKTAAFEGVVVGLTASGLFSSGKNVLQDLEKNKIGGDPRDD